MTASSPDSVSLRHAVVMGGSIAGLVAARILLNHFNRVTLIERDRLSDGSAVRPGVAQASHVHVLLVEGYRQIERLFPGITNDLCHAGAISVEWTKEWGLLAIPGWFPAVPSSLQSYSCSRTLLEQLIRQRLKKDERLTILDGCQVEHLVMDQTQTTVTGVQIRQRHPLSDELPPTPSILNADFVVDASGRNSKFPEWLTEMGYAAPSETTINAFLGYATCWYARPSHVSLPCKGITVAPRPGETLRGAVLCPVEGDRWVVTLVGINKDYPPTDEAGFLEFAHSLRDPIIHDLIQTATPLSPIHSYRRTENRLRHYEKLPRFPDGIVVMGDAVCAFNPTYGQGMTVATLEACLLDQELRKALSHQHHLQGFSRQFQRKLAKLVQMPWLLATGEDSRFPETVSSQQSWATRLVQKYVDQVILCALDNPRIFCMFAEVLHMVKPASTLFHPSILRAVMLNLGRSPQQGSVSPFQLSDYTNAASAEKL